MSPGSQPLSVQGVTGAPQTVVDPDTGRAMRQFAKEILCGGIYAEYANEFGRVAGLASRENAVKKALMRNERKCVEGWLEQPLLRKMVGANLVEPREIRERK
jgi:hypothetical protein